MAVISPTTTDKAKDAHYQFVSSYISDLRGIIGYYTGYVERWMADSVESYDLLKNDWEIKKDIHVLSIMVAAEDWRINCKDVMLKWLLTKAVGNIKDYTHARKSLAENGILFGLGVQKIYWEKKRFRATGNIEWEVPKYCKEVDVRRMRLERNPKDRNDIYWTIWNPGSDNYKIIQDRSKVPNAALAMQDFVWYIHEHEERSPLYRGLGEVLWRAAYVKDKLLQYAADLCEHWGKPIMGAVVDDLSMAFNSASSLGDAFQNWDSIVDKWLDTLDKMRARHNFVYAKGDKIDVHEGGAQSNNIIHQFLEYIDDKIQTLLLGSKLITDSPEHGTFALGQIHRGTSQTIITYNRKRLEEVNERDIVWNFLYRNAKNLQAIGVEWPESDEVNIEFYVRSEELREQALAQGDDRDVRSADKI